MQKLRKWLERLPFWLKPPIVHAGDDDANRRAYVVHVISLTVISAGVVGITANYLSGSTTAMLPVITGILLVILAYVLNQHSRIQAAGLLLIAAMLWVVTRLLMVGNGIHDISITLYPAIMIMVSLLLENRAIILGYLLILISLGVVIFGEIGGYFTSEKAVNPADPADFIILAAILTVIGVSLRLITRYLQRSMHQARQSASALQISEEALRRSSEQLSALNKITIAINHLQSLEDVLEDILVQLQAALPLDVFFVSLYDSKDEMITYPIMYDSGSRIQEKPIKLIASSMVKHVITTSQPLLLNRTEEEIIDRQRYPNLMVGNRNRISASILMVPLQSSGENIGVVSTQSYTQNAYTQEHLEFLQGAASQITIAIQNARLYDALHSELAERRRSETALRQSEARLRAIIENIPYDLWMCDTAGRYVIQSSVSLRMAGNAIGKLPDDLNFPEEVKRSWVNLHRRALDGQIVLEEASWPLDGEIHSFLTMLAPVRDEDGMLGFVGMNVDITDLKRSEEALRHYAERIEILHQIDQAILAVRSPQEIAVAALSRLPHLMHCTSASLALLDVPAGTAQVVAIYSQGETHPGSGEIVTFNDPPRLEQLLAGDVVVITDLDTQPLEGPPSLNRVLLQGPVHAVIVVPLRHQEQLVGVLSVGAEKRGQLSQEDVKIISEIAIQLAISIHQSQLVTTVQQLNTELEQRVMQRTAELEAAYRELEAFSYSVSHDLRAPLRGVTGYISLFMEDYGVGLEAAARDYLQRIQTSARRMNLLIDDILTLSRIGRQTLRCTKFNLHKLFQEVLDEQLVGKDSTRIHITLHPMPVVVADRSLLRQVAQNLVDNALKYSRSQPVAEVEIGSLEQENRPVFYVKDNGVGFDMRFADRLFTPFQRFHSQDEFEGTGIGLAIVHRILQRHGGSVWVETAPGQGTTFYFTIPEITEE